MRCRVGAARVEGHERIVVSGSDGDGADIERIEGALREWRQGDATLDVGTFLVHLADKRTPLTADARDAVARGEVDADENVFEVLSPVKGLVVVSQSCDIVRKCSKSECVEVSPLVLIEDERQIEGIRKRQRTRYAYLPGLADRKLVVDLERSMTASVHYRDTDIRLRKSYVITIAWAAQNDLSLKRDSAKDGSAALELCHGIRHLIYG